MIDYHIHTSLSTDCDFSMKQMAQAAIDQGLKYISFTDHIDFDFPNGEFMVDFSEYRKHFEDVKKAFPQINIAKGIEAGIEPHSFHRYKELFKDQELDFVLGSVHVVFGYDPYFPDLWNSVTKQQAFDEYAVLSLKCIDAIEVFDVLGHIGYIGKYCPFENNLFRYSDYTDIIDTILKKLIEHSKGLEVNTSGLLKTADYMPEKPIIERYHELGGEIVTIGSDAHLPENVGFAAKDTLEYLNHIGFKYVFTYNQREPIAVSIDKLCR